MKLKEYLKSQYNLKGLSENSKSFEYVILEKLYGRKMNIYDWIDNISFDGPEDGGIDFIVVEIDGKIIPLLQENDFSEQLEEILLSNVSEDNIKRLLDSLSSVDELSTHLYSAFNKKKCKLTINFIQSKSGNSIQERVLNKIKTTVEDLILNEEFSSIRYSDKLKNNIKFIKKLIEIISINEGAIEFNLLYIAKDEATPNSLPIFQEIANNIEKIIRSGIKHNNVKVLLLYGSELIGFLEKTDNQNLRLKIDRKNILYKSNNYCLGLIKLSELKKFVSLNGNLDVSLFDGNVRDSYKTSSSINKEIMETLKNKIAVRDFWWLNNGITIICEKLTMKGNTLFVSSPQIVNGLQSVVAIFDTLSSGSLLNEKKNIIVKFLVENNDENINLIIKTTNNQNPVDIYLLKSTQKIHKKIERYFLTFGDGYFYDRRKNYYKNINKDKSRIFDIKYTFKTYASIFFKIPSQVRTSTKSNFQSKHDDVFNESINENSYLYADLLDRNIQKVLKGSEIDLDFKSKNGVSIITYSLHLALIYTSLLKKTLDYTDKYISNKDILTVQSLKYDDSVLSDSIDILKEAMKEYSSENKVYLARSKDFEDSINKKLKEKLKNKR